MARELKVTYGALVMSAAPYEIDGPWTKEIIDSTSRGLSWRVLVTGGTEAAFKANVDTFEAAFDDRYQDLTAEIGSETMVTAAQGSNTGFLQHPEAVLVDEDAWTARSRIYECSVHWAVPAADNGGLRGAQIRVIEDDAGIRTLSISGEYTAMGGNTAVAQMNSALPTLASTERSSLGGTWDEAVLEYEYDDQNKVATFSRVEVEIIYDQSSGATNHASITRPDIRFSRARVGPGNTPGKGAQARLTISASYSTSIRAGATLNLRSFYEGTIRPYMLSEAKRIFLGGTAAVVSEDPSLDKSGNRIDASFVIEVTAGGSVYSYTATQTLTNEPGTFLVPVWDGNKWAKNKYQGPASATRVTRVSIEHGDLVPLHRVTTLGEVSSPSTNGGRPADPDQVGQWDVVRTEPTHTPLEIGVDAFGEKIATTLTEWLLIETYFEEPKKKKGPVTTGGGSEGGGSSTDSDAVTTPSIPDVGAPPVSGGGAQDSDVATGGGGSGYDTTVPRPTMDDIGFGAGLIPGQ